MKITAEQKYKLKKFVKNLEQYRGRHTELVTVYVPSGYDITKITTLIAQEQGTASNIKSTQTRKNVIDALERMLQHLKLYKQTPPNGLAVFSGNVAEREGQSDVQVWSIEPPVPIQIRLYRCDKEFVLDPLQEMADTEEVFGLIVMDRRDGDVGLLKGKAVIPLVHTHSTVPGKTRAGGQSAQRFERLREGAAIEFYKRIADYVKEQFLENKDVKAILVGGPGQTKYDFVEGSYITADVKKKIIAVKDLSYTGEFGLQELVDRCQDVLAQEEIADEKKIMGKFFELLATDPDKVGYGKDSVMDYVKQGAVETLLISEIIDDNTEEEFEKEASLVGTEIKIISTDTREGSQLKDMGGIAAILRYAVQ
ncbi:MAG: peptide chain release factor aRF-1 [Candidatus Woesearchaeota archaeon]